MISLRRTKQESHKENTKTKSEENVEGEKNGKESVTFLLKRWKLNQK